MGKSHTNQHVKPPKLEKFDFQKMKESAMSDDSAVRKASFIEYFERFAEFPSFLFDNEYRTDTKLVQTIQDLLNDPDTSKELRVGVDLMIRRLPSA